MRRARVICQPMNVQLTNLGQELGFEKISTFHSSSLGDMRWGKSENGTMGYNLKNIWLWQLPWILTHGSFMIWRYFWRQIDSCFNLPQFCDGVLWIFSNFKQWQKFGLIKCCWCLTVPPSWLLARAAWWRKSLRRKSGLVSLGRRGPLGSSPHSRLIHEAGPWHGGGHPGHHSVHSQHSSLWHRVVATLSGRC